MVYQINSECYKNLKYQEFTSNKRQNKEKELDKYNFEDKKKEKDIIPSNEEKSTNIQSIFLEHEISKTADKDLILEFIKIIERNANKNSAENIYETQNGNYVCGYSNNLLIIFDNNFCEKLQIKDLNDSPFCIS